MSELLRLVGLGSEATTEGRIAALDRLAQQSGKSRREMFVAVRDSWGLTLGERVEIERHLANTDEPPSQAELDAQKAAQKQAREQQATHAKQEHVARINERRKFRELRERNPFAASRAGLADPSLFDDPEPDEAA